MLTPSIRTIIETARPTGWVLEPDAKQIMESQGFDIPGSVLTDSFEIAGKFLNASGGMVVVKAVSQKILHKTEFKAVVTGIGDKKTLEQEMARLLTLEGCRQVLVEEMVEGIELLVGAKNDFQFGPVIVLGLGGTAVEIYQDTAIRMAPITQADVPSMVDSLKAGRILKGYRNAPGVNMEALASLLVKFSLLVMDLEQEFLSIDLNPVICTRKKCVIADARIILAPLNP